MPDIVIENRDGVRLIILNRPQAKNALTPSAQHDLVREVEAAVASDEVGAIVVAGAGGTFCAGGDISAMSEGSDRSIVDQVADLNARQRVITLIRGATKPVIAAIDGAAMGAGLGIALACDIRIASPGARFGAVYRNVALTGDFGISWLLTQEIGAGRARQMLFDATVVNAETALSWGLVHEIDEHGDDLLEFACEKARGYVNGPRSALAWMKANLLDAQRHDLHQTLRIEAERLIAAKQTPEHAAAVRAFLDRK